MKAILIIATCFCLFATACTTVGKADVTETTSSKTRNPSEGKALVYVIRTAGYFGAVITSAIHIDTTWIGATGGKSFVFGEATPGSHTIYITGGEKKYNLPFSFEANKTYYFKQNVKMGALYARFSLTPLSEKEGKENLKNCPLSAKRPSDSN